MKAYNLISREHDFTFGTMPAIALGERGRGRRLVFVPCPLEIQDGELVSIAKSRTNRPKVVRGGDTEGWLARVSTEGAYIRGAWGIAYAPKGTQVEVVAKGYGAFGLAGRVGTWFDYLLKIPDDTLIKVKPSRGPHYFLWFPKTGQPRRIEEDEIDIFLEATPEAQYQDEWTEL